MDRYKRSSQGRSTDGNDYRLRQNMRRQTPKDELHHHLLNNLAINDIEDNQLSPYTSASTLTSSFVESEFDNIENDVRVGIIKIIRKNLVYLVKFTVDLQIE
jgi:hypothetical protein